MKVQDRVVVVTGAGNGIGRQVVLELLRRRAKVAAVDIRRESLDETADLAAAETTVRSALAEQGVDVAVTGSRLATFVTDVTDRNAVAALPEKVKEALGEADAVINVAGIIQPFVHLNDLAYESIDRVINVNLYGTLHMVKAFLPGLIERPVAHLANVSSMGGFLPVPGQTIYGATKAAVKLMTEGLYAELRDTSVGVSAIMPGAVETEITSNSGVEMPSSASTQDSRFPTTSPQDAARIIVDGIEKDRFHIYVGKDARILNLMSRAAPKQATHLIQSQMKNLLSS